MVMAFHFEHLDFSQHQGKGAASGSKFFFTRIYSCNVPGGEFQSAAAPTWQCYTCDEAPSAMPYGVARPPDPGRPRLGAREGFSALK